MIERNRHPAGRRSNVVFGLCQCADGLVRIFSLGYLHTRFCINYARRQAKRKFDKTKGGK